MKQTFGVISTFNQCQAITQIDLYLLCVVLYLGGYLCLIKVGGKGPTEHISPLQTGQHYLF